jgi:S1-C subfamily serine protease
MKIFILTFLFCLLPFNLNAQALLSNCYDSSRSSSFNAQGINEEDKIEINENKTILRRTQIRLDSAIKKNPEWGKVHAQTYKINYFDDNIINAETLSPSKTLKFIINVEPKKKKFSHKLESNISVNDYGTSIYVCEKVNLVSASKPEGGTNKGSSSGSAFFINNKGNIVTNNHVVERCNGPVKVLYNKKEYNAKVIAKDGTLDLAALSSDIKPNQYLKFSKNSGDKLDRVVAAGFPLGYKISDELKVTAGIVSATKGWKDNINEFQIDAALNPGNSGGPVVNDAGNLFGVAVAGLTDRQNLNFAIKSKAVKDFLDVNKVSYSTATVEFDMDNKKRLKLLEDSTVFIYCN